jgi:hypothetical protein
MASWQEQMASNLAFAQRADKAPKVYLSDAHGFARFWGRPPEEPGRTEVRARVEHRIAAGTAHSRAPRSAGVPVPEHLGRPEPVPFFS